MPRAIPPPTQIKVTIRDWLLTAISALFTITGLLMLRTDMNGGLVLITMFGSGFAFSIHTILRKKRARLTRPVQATVIGSAPIRPPRQKAIFVAVAMLAMGLVFTIFGQSFGTTFQLISGLLVIAGACVGVAIAAGVLPAGFIQFDPLGLTFGGSKWKATVPWSSISNMVEAELHDNPAIFLWVSDPQEIVVEPATYKKKVLKQVALSQSWVGADYAIMPSQYNIDAPVMFAALARYVSTPSARAELLPQAKIENF